MEATAAIEFFDYAKVLLVAILLYAIIFAMLKKVAFFGDDKVNALVSLISALLVSFSGIVTYIVTYTINWFAIIFFIVFVVILLLLFMGANFDEVKGMLNPKVVGGILGVLFLIILVKGFFGVNNLFDTNEPQQDPYAVNTSYNTGVNDVTGVGVTQDSGSFLDSIDSDLLAVIFFLLIIGIFVIIIGR